MGQKALRFFIDIAKWLLVAWLLYPLRRRMQLPLEFARSAAGILLFVIFAGKMLYDSVIWRQLTGASRDSPRDLLSIVAIIFIIAMLLGVALFFVGLYVASIYQRSIEPEPEL
jgi:hypothetical protein